MKQRQVDASIKIFQAKNNQLWRVPAFPVWSLKIMKEFMKFSILSHNQPRISGLQHLRPSCLRNSYQLWSLPMSQNGGNKENITTEKYIQVRSRLWSAEQLKAGIFSAVCHRECLHLTLLPSATIDWKLAYNKPVLLWWMQLWGEWRCCHPQQTKMKRELEPSNAIFPFPPNPSFTLSSHNISSQWCF